MCTKKKGSAHITKPVQECIGITSFVVSALPQCRCVFISIRCSYFRANSSNVSLTFGSATGFHKTAYFICLSILFMSIRYDKTGLS